MLCLSLGWEKVEDFPKKPLVVDLRVGKGGFRHPFGYPGKRRADLPCSVFGLTVGALWAVCDKRNRDVLGRGNLNERFSQESQIRHVDQRQVYLAQFRGRERARDELHTKGIDHILLITLLHLRLAGRMRCWANSRR
jgi:hypothetical protein